MLCIDWRGTTCSPVKYAIVEHKTIFSAVIFSGTQINHFEFGGENGSGWRWNPAVRCIHANGLLEKKSQKHTHTAHIQLERNSDSIFCMNASECVCLLCERNDIRTIGVIHFKMHGFDLIRANSWYTLALLSPSPFHSFAFFSAFFGARVRNHHRKLKQYSVSLKHYDCQRQPHCPKIY